jgi:hypothetical protein
MADLGGFDRKSKSLIGAMLAAGWTGRRTSKGHWLGKAPDGNATITVPSKMDKPNRTAQNVEAAFSRWLATQDIPALEELITASHNYDPDSLIDEVIRKGAVKHAVEGVMEHAETLTHKEDPVTPANPAATVVSLVPWKAKLASNPKGGKVYDSAATMERRWSNGYVDYLCALKGCGYSSDNARSVSTHYGKAHTVNGEGTPYAEAEKVVSLDMDYLEPGYRRDVNLEPQRAYNPQERLVSALTDWLSENWTKELSMEEVSTLFLTWAHERPDLEHIERETRPLTDEEIVTRIREIVGQPIAVELKEAKALIDQLQAEIAQRTAERDDIAARLMRVQKDLNAFTEMLGSIGA